MNEDDVILPTGEQIHLLFLERHEVPQGPLAYLHHIRNSRTLGMLGVDVVESTFGVPYYRSLPRFTQDSSRCATEQSLDLIVSPPSSRHDACPYRQAIQHACPTALDITPYFTKDPKIKAIQPTTTINALIVAISTVGVPDLARFEHIAITDELFSCGNTIAAMLHHLRNAGLRADAKVTVCAPLRLG